MNSYTQKNPILFLRGSVTSVSVLGTYEYDDGSGLGPSGSSLENRFQITVSSIGEQAVGTNLAGASQSKYKN